MDEFSLGLKERDNCKYILSKSSLIVWVHVGLYRTVVDSDWRFNNLCGSHLQSQNELFHVSWRYSNSGYWSDWSVRLLLWVVRQLSRDVTVIGSFPLKLFSFVLDVFESGHSTSYWGKFGPLDPLDGRWYAWWNLSKWFFLCGNYSLTNRWRRNFKNPGNGLSLVFLPMGGGATDGCHFRLPDR